MVGHERGIRFYLWLVMNLPVVSRERGIRFLPVTGRERGIKFLPMTDSKIYFTCD